MKNWIATVAILLWVLTVGVFSYFFVQGWTTAGVDKRIAVQLAPAERELVLAEMRQMLTSVHGLIDAAAHAQRSAVYTADRFSDHAPLCIDYDYAF